LVFRIKLIQELLKIRGFLGSNSISRTF
jgi:hypothetical protein